jgi:hypothetical protein
LLFSPEGLLSISRFQLLTNTSPKAAVYRMWGRSRRRSSSDALAVCLRGYVVRGAAADAEEDFLSGGLAGV